VLSQERADLRDPCVVSRGLLDIVRILGDRHRPKLVNHDFMAIEPVAPLLEYDRARRRQFDREGDRN
jgi:hypothetical protein